MKYILSSLEWLFMVALIVVFIISYLKRNREKAALEAELQELREGKNLNDLYHLYCEGYHVASVHDNLLAKFEFSSEGTNEYITVILIDVTKKAKEVGRATALVTVPIYFLQSFNVSDKKCAINLYGELAGSCKPIKAIELAKECNNKELIHEIKGGSNLLLETLLNMP